MRLRISRPRLRRTGPRGDRGGPLAAGDVVFLRLEVVAGARDITGHAVLVLDEASPDWSGLITQACRLTLALPALSAFDAWLELESALAVWGPRHGHPPAAVAAVTAWLERALLDAVAQRAGRPLQALLFDVRSNPIGLDLARLDRELTGLRAADLLHPHAPVALWLRHRQAATRAAADLPGLLAEVPLRHVELVLSGDPEADVAGVIAGVEALEQAIPPGRGSWSIDGAGAYGSTGAFHQFWTELRSAPGLLGPLHRLAYIVDPFARRLTADGTVGRFLKGWPSAVPLVHSPEPGAGPLAAALDAGLAGAVRNVAHGWFRALADFALLKVREAAGPRRHLPFLARLDAHWAPIGGPQLVALAASLGSDVVSVDIQALADAAAREDEGFCGAPASVLGGWFRPAEPGRRPALATPRVPILSALQRPTAEDPAVADWIFGPTEAAA